MTLKILGKINFDTITSKGKIPKNKQIINVSVFNMNIYINISVGTRETGMCVLVLKWTTPQSFVDDEWNVLFKCHVEDNGEWWECTIYSNTH